MFEDWKPTELIALAAVAATWAAVVATCAGMYVSRRTTLTALDKQIDTQIKIATLQHREASTANKRQDWINQLRQLLARFLAIAPLIKNKERREEAYRTFLSVYSEVELMLNPLESDHQKLLSILEKYFRSVDASEMMFVEQAMETPRRNLLVARAQIVLKREWQLVKTGSIDPEALRGLYEIAEKLSAAAESQEADLRKRQRG